MPRSNGLPPGTLILLILRVVRPGPLHGYAIAQRIRALSSEQLSVEEGSLYPALQRMKRKGWIHSEWRVTENNRRARYYLLTPAGERQLEREMAEWARASSGVNWVLGWNGGAA